MEQDNVFTFTDYNGFVLYLNGANVITDIKIIDDVWHFVCGIVLRLLLKYFARF